MYIIVSVYHDLASYNMISCVGLPQGEGVGWGGGRGGCDYLKGRFVKLSILNFFNCLHFSQVHLAFQTATFLQMYTCNNT
jgi:hypothetical protein